LNNLTQAELRQIFSGDVQAEGGDWTTLGHNTNSSDKTIVVCQRTAGSGTLATLAQTIMQSPGWFTNINPTPDTVNPGTMNIFNPSSSNMQGCIQNNPNSIGYLDDDTTLTGGAHQVAVDGFLPSNPGLTAGIDRTRDVRCGKYIYWADWNIVTRKSTIDGAPINAAPGTQALLNLYQSRAVVTNPLPNFWADQTNTFVLKNSDAGPHHWFTPNGAGADAGTKCSNDGSVQ